MEQVVDPARQQYLFQYSKQGKLMGLAVQGAKVSSGQRLAQSKN
jgi:predicted ester cyclase